MISVVCAFAATSCSAPRIAWLAATPPAATSALRRAELLVKQPQADARAGRRSIPAPRPESRRRDRRCPAARSGSSRAGLVAHRGLQARQREIGVGAPEHRPRKREASGIAAGGGALDLRAARIGQPEHFCHLVEGLAHGVVDGGAEPHIVADADHGDDLGVAAGGEKQAIGKRQRAGQPRRQRVGLEMVDRDQRRVVHHRDRLRGGQADDDAADQAGAGGGGDRRQAAQSRRRLPSWRGRRCRRARRHGRAPRSPAPRRRRRRAPRSASARYWTESVPTRRSAARPRRPRFRRRWSRSPAPALTPLSNLSPCFVDRICERVCSLSGAKRRFAYPR